jgi:hypothetical protein
MSNAEDVMNMTYLKSLINPEIAIGAPGLNQQTDVAQDITVLGTFTARALPQGALQNGIDATTGLITWNPLRGVGCINRLGMIPSGMTCRTATSLTLPSTYVGALGNGITHITYPRTMWVSYEQEQQPTISPQLATDFTFSKFQKGMLALHSATRSGSTIDLSGQLHAGSWADSRDGWQKATGSVTPTQLAELSVNKKDSCIGVDPIEGVVVVGGSDSATEYSYTNMQEYITHMKGITPNVRPTLGNGSPSGVSYELSLAGEVFGPANKNTKTFNPARFANAAVDAVWVTPWDTVPALDNTTAGVNSTAFEGLRPQAVVGSQWRVYQMPNIGQYSTVSFNCNIQWGIEDASDTIYKSAPGALGDLNNLGGLRLDVCVEDVFAVILNDSLNNNTPYDVVEHRSIAHKYGPFYPRGTSPNTDAVVQGAQTFNHTPVARSDIGQTYIGSLISVHVTGMLDSTQKLILTNLSYLVINPVVNSAVGDGDFGPVRIMMYEKVSDGQQLTVKGRMTYNCVASGSVAPYVKPSAMSLISSEDINWLSVASQLFNGPTQRWRRVYTGSAYSYMVNNYLPGLTLDMLRGPNAAEHVDPVTVQKIEAAGFFDFITKNLANLGRSFVKGAVGTAVNAGLGALPGGGFVAKYAGPAINNAIGSMIGAGEFEQGGVNPQMYGGGMFGQGWNQQGALVPSSGGMYSAGMESAGMYPESSAHFRHKRHRGY